MTDRELMQQALEALQSSVPTHDGFLQHCKAMNHIRIRLAQPLRTHWEGCDEVHPECKQPRREWVGLTEEEIALVCGECAASAHRADDISYARAIEAKLKEKNT